MAGSFSLTGRQRDAIMSSMSSLRDARGLVDSGAKICMCISSPDDGGRVITVAIGDSIDELTALRKCLEDLERKMRIRLGGVL